ncbi:MAG: hypothetical protein Q4G08_06740 [Capnocytophaga sp.]|nr:hypothetical protein [Capnocytophaga sp.]
MKKLVLCTFSVGIILFSQAQELLPLSVRQKDELKESSWVKETPFESITHPAAGSSLSGFSIHPSNALEMVVAPQGGGLWHSQNGGETFVPLFDNQPTQQIDALAVHWAAKLIWVGTPYGLFYSDDFGKTWNFGGLPSVQRITSIVINPKNKSDITVGVLGDRYQADEKRGIFRTTDNGATWQQKLFVGTRTGIIQIVSANNTLYASAWQINDNQWETNPYGRQSSVYKSDDNGNSWKKITQNNGFPSGDFIGRIGLAVYDNATVYALVDNRAGVAKSHTTSVEKTQRIHLSEKDISTMGKPDFIALDDNKLSAYLHTQGLSHKYSAQNLKNMIKADVTSPARLTNYLGMLPKEIIGAQVYLTTDGGKSWTKTHPQPLTDTYYHDGNLMGAIAVNPKDKNEVIIGGYPLLKSNNAGKSWENISGVSLGNIYTNVSIHPQGSVFVSDKNGLNISYNNDNQWIVKNISAATDFKRITYNTAENSLFVAGNNGAWSYKNKLWQKLMPSASQVISAGSNTYTAGRLGNFHRYDIQQDEMSPLGTTYVFEDKAALRFGPSAPMEISKQNPDIVYVGSNKLHMSLDKGEHWRTISEDLTNGDKKGNKAYGTLSAIAESPFLFGLIYTGSDDGMVHVSKNGGVSWQLIYNAFPQPLMVSRIVASRHQRNKVFVVLRSVDANTQEPFVFMSDDFGKTWNNLRTNLPDGSANVLKEDPNNEQILYLGTQSGLYISFNLGESWHPFTKNIPNVGVNDIYIDDKSGEMTVATSGRGLYKTSVKYMRQLRAAIIAHDFFPLDDEYRIKHITQWGNTWSQWATPTRPSITFTAFSGNEGLPITVKIIKDGVTLQLFTHNATQGFNYLTYDLTISDVGKVMYEKKLQKLVLTKAVDGNIYLPQGTYEVSFTGEGVDEVRKLIVE